MLPCGTDDERQTREDRATQPLDAGRLSFAKQTVLWIGPQKSIFSPPDPQQQTPSLEQIEILSGVFKSGSKYQWWSMNSTVFVFSQFTSPDPQQQTNYSMNRTQNNQSFLTWHSIWPQQQAPPLNAKVKKVKYMWPMWRCVPWGRQLNIWNAQWKKCNYALRQAVEQLKAHSIEKASHTSPELNPTQNPPLKHLGAKTPYLLWF